MRFYLTGAPTPGAPQPLGDRSLGGYVAATPLENATEGNLFGATGRQALLKLVTRHRLLAVRNETGATVTDVRVWLQPAPEATALHLTWALALVTPALDEHGAPYFETLGRDIARPSYATFLPDPDESGALTLATPLAAGGVLGIWLRQTPADWPTTLPILAGEAATESTTGPPADIVAERTLALAWT